MKKNYLLIVDFFLNSNKIALSKGLISFVKKLSEIIDNGVAFFGRQSRTIVAVFSFLFFGLHSYAQNLVPFGVRYNTSLKGDMLLIGNNILSQHRTNDYNNITGNTSATNNNINMVNVDIDSDNSTTNSSSANLTVPSTAACYKIKYAGLYWGAVEKGSSAIANIKFKLPGATEVYRNLTGSVIYNQNASTTNNNESNTYVCYSDVTSLLTGLTNPQGTYTVANVSTAVNNNNDINVEGLSAGWSLIIIYEDPTLPSKNITTFDGFSRISGGNNQNIVVSGFQTIPSGEVKAKYAFSAFEGDRGRTADFLRINNTTPNISATNSGGTLIRPANDFFNSSISTINPATNTPETYLDRNPKSLNTLGFDAGILSIPNGNGLNTVIGNGHTSATITLGTANNNSGDIYYFYFNAFAVEVIEPKIELIKRVENAAGADIGNTNVQPQDVLNYVISFRNKGNDDATSFTIKDQLPVNTVFNYPTDMGTLPTGVTVGALAFDTSGNQISGFNPATRTIIFNISPSIVKIGSGITTIRLKVKVSDCDKLADACSNTIDNQAFATYKGSQNTSFFITDDPSLDTSAGCLTVPKATNFLVGVENCQFERTAVLCGTSVTLTAANGYNSYSWSTSPTGSPVIAGGISQSLSVSAVGTYYARNTAIAPCISIVEKFVVTGYSITSPNPVIPFASQVLECTNDGKKLPVIFLCGTNDSRNIQTGISDGSTIVWEKLNESTTCPAATNATLCANESSTCSWSQVATGPDYNVNSPGQYRLTLTYAGGVCFNRFYFNVFQNNFTPTVTHKDILCTPSWGPKGNITVTNPVAGSGYEYSLYVRNSGAFIPATVTGVAIGNASSTPIYQTSNIFTIDNPGLYAVYIKQTSVTNPCIFKVEDIQVLKVDLNKTFDPLVSHPKCYGDKGSIHIYANAHTGTQYTYELFKAGVSVNKVGPITNSDYAFTGLDSGDYTFTVTTDDGCGYTNYYTHINDPAGQIIAIPSIKKALTPCSDGIIKVTATQLGNYNSPRFAYFVNGSTTPINSDWDGTIEFPVTTSGLYTIRVVGANVCETTVTQQIDLLPKPIYNIPQPANLKCYNDNATITVNVSNANGYSLEYSKDNGGNFQTSNTFSNLTPGTYNIVVRYGMASDPKTSWCTDTAQTFVITGPKDALTASAGVAELAGCTLPDGAGINQGGKIRITNAQGGTGTYQYSFDGGLTYGSSPEANKLPGTYVLYVKDSNDCIFVMPAITLDTKIQDPVIDNNVDPVYNCDGTATATIEVNTPPTTGVTYTYEYYLKTGASAPVPNTPITSNVFTNVPSGSHTVIVKYNIVSATSFSNLLQEDFGRGGFTTTPGINPAYCFEDETTPHPVGFPCGGFNDYQINDGKYAVASSINTTFGGTWLVAKDHTLPSHPLGRFLVVNVGGSAGIGGILYSKPIKDVIANQPVLISLWAENLIKSIHPGYDDPKLTIQLVNNLNGVGGPETIVATTPVATPWIVPKSDKWEYKELSLNPLAFTNLSFVIRSYNNAFNGNDVLLDDIWVRQTPKSCITEKEIPIVIGTNKAFTGSVTGFENISCPGLADGKITIEAQNFDTATGFQYSKDGVTWLTSTTSPVTLIGLTAGTYTPQIRFNNLGACTLVLTPRTITAPTPIIVRATATLATCLTGATVNATTTTGGTPAYTFELVNTIAPFTVTNFPTSGILTNVAPGTYSVRATDAKGCIANIATNLVIAGPTNPTAILSGSSDFCYDTVNQATLVVTASNGVGPYTYQLGTNTAQTSNTFTNVGPGTYSITVTDSNSCTFTISDIIIEPQLQFNAILAQDLTCLADASITATTGGGYAPYTYTVSRNSTTATSASFPFTATQPGSYVFTVTDSRNCTTTSTITVSPKTTPTLIANKTDITCNNANDGTITVTPANGFTTTYTYAIKLNSATTYTTQVTNQFTGLAAGTYNIKVIDSKGCESAVTDVTILNPPIVTGNIGATQLQCSTTGTVAAVVTVTAGGGVAPYKYSFNGASNFNATNTFSTTIAGSVTAYIQDFNGCQIGPLTVTIGTLQPITSISLVDNGYDCSTTPPGGQVTIAAVKAGTANVTNYQIISGPTGFSTAVNTTGIFQGLAAGSYIFQATDTQTNCVLTKDHTVSGTPAIVAGGSVTSPIKCFAGTGNIQFTVSGVGTDGYDYIIRNAANINIQSANSVSATVTTIAVTASQPAGVYTITVTDRKTQCTDDYVLTLTQPTAAVSITSAIATNVNCNNGNSQITVVAAGGTPNYTYAFAQSPSTVPTSTYGVNPVLTVNTTSGTNLIWDVYVKDANDCIETTTVTIISDPTPSVTAVINNQCSASGSAFTIEATGTNGTGTLTYGINGITGAFQSGNTFNVTASATPYTVWVKDANGCTASATPITVYPQLAASAVVTKTLDCSTSPDAVITTTISGGRAPYTHTVQKGIAGTPSTPSVASSALTFTYDVSNANADTYIFVVTDANNCTSTSTVIVNPITNPTVTPTPTAVSCNGGTNGSVLLSAAGGSGGYTYSFNGSAFTTDVNYTGLSAGIAYTYQVRDNKGCVSTPATITLTEPTALVVSGSATSFSCSATNTKQSALVTIDEPTTGTAPYEYSFNGGGYTSTRTLTVNDNGTNQIINYSVKDNNGCIQAGTAITINRLNPPTIANIVHTDINCAPLNTTSTVTVTKTTGTGVGTLTYAITVPAASATSNTTGIFAGLAGGITYTFKVTDANGCFAIDSHTVPAVNPIAVTATKLTDVDCSGNTTGAIRYNVSGYSTTYSYSVNGATAVTGQTDPLLILSNLGAAAYTVVFTDETTACTVTPTAITIAQPAILDLALISNVNANCTKATSTVTVNATGGTSTYQYAILDADDTTGIPVYGPSAVFNINSNLGADLNWVIYVKDAKGCIDTLPVTIATDPIPSVTATVQNQCAGTGSSFIINAVGSGGIAPYTYTINTGVAPTGALLDTFTVAPGTYTITVRDANNCPATTTVTVNPVLTVSAALTKDLTCAPAPTEAIITINATGGLAGYTYRVSFNGGAFGAPTLPDTIIGNVFTTSTAGSYRFEVTDSNTPIPACTKITNSVIINPITNPDITTIDVTQEILCYGESSAIIKVNQDLTRGVAPFTYTVVQTTAPFTNFGNKISGLPAGTYDVTVTDAKGCTDTEEVIIGQPTPIIVEHHELPITCDSSNPLVPQSKGSIIIDKITNVLGGVGGSGGTAPYNYFVTGVNGYSEEELNNSGTTSTTFNVVDFGLYQINVVDANGCSVLVQDVLVASPPDDLDITVSSPPADCSVQGSALVAIGAGTTPPSSITGAGPFYFRIYDGILPTINAADIANGTWLPESSVGSKEANFTNLIPGVTYTFVVYDSNGLVIPDGGTGSGCYYFETADTPIPTASTLTTTTPVVKNVTCKELPALADGSVSFDIISTYTTATNVSYQIINAQSLVPIGLPGTGTVPPIDTVTIPNVPGRLTITDFGALPFGNYFVLINEVHANPADTNCSVPTVPFNITESSIPLTVTATVVQNDNCNKLGIISALGHDGTGPYEYRVGTSGAWQSDNTFDLAGSLVTTTPVNAGTTYVIYVKDAYGCEKSVSIDLPKDPEPVIALDVPNKCAIEGAFEIEVSQVTAGVGPYYISVNSPTAYQNLPASYPVTPFVVTGLNSGSNTIYVKDSNGCFDTQTIIIDEPLEITPAITDLPTCADNDGTITLTGTGGTNSYTFSILPMPASASITGNIISGLPAGTYTVTMTDAINTSCTITASVTLIPPTPVTFTTVQNNATCNGASDGIITVNLLPGNNNPNYTYEIIAPITRAAQSSNVFNGLEAGTYTVRVNSGRGCSTDDATVVVGEPLILDASATVAAYTCNATNIPQPAVVTVNVTPGTGTAPYQYNFDGPTAPYYNPNTLLVTDNGLPQTIHYYVKDANGCLFDDTVIVPAYQKITNLTFTVLPITCDNPTRDLTVAVVGGYTPIAKYEIISPVSAIDDNGSDPIFTALGAGTYLFKVTDANGCSFEKSHTIAPVSNITVSGQLINDVSCNPGSNGEVTFTVGNFAGTYSYTINSGLPITAQTAATINLPNLGIGNQVIVVTDDVTGCTATETINVSQPTAPLSLSEVISARVNANCDNGAKVEVLAAGGTPNYTYAFVADGVTPLLTDYTSSASAVLPFTGTLPNDWDVWVKDNKDCTFKLDIVTNLDVSPTIALPAPQCFVGTPITIDLSIPAVTTVPVGPAKYYTINGSDQTSATYSITAPGTYKLSVTDANGCISNEVDYIVQPQLTLTATLTQDLTCALNANITLTAEGGLAPYVTYEVNDGSGYVVSANPFTTTTAGTYTFRVTDTQTCQAVSSAVTVTPNTTPTATPLVTSVSCIGETDGTITLTPSGGIIPYEYSIDGVNYQTSNVFEGLGFGPQTILVRDAKMCVSTPIAVTINQPTAVTATAVVTPFGCDTANAPEDAIVTITATDGTPGYTYSFDNGVNWQTSASFTVNNAQTITYVVHDSNGCSFTDSVVVDPYTPPTDMNLSASPIYCNTPGTVATVTVNSVTSGVAPYTYEIISPATAVTLPSAPSPAPFSFANLAPATYTIKVTDANGCSTTKSIVVEEADKIQVAAQLINNVYCNGGSTGAVNFTVANYITPVDYTYSLSPALGSDIKVGDVISYTGLPAGNYTFTVTDNVSGCMDDVVNFTISEPALPLSSTSVATNINCDIKTALVTITAEHGTAPYKYAIARATDPAPALNTYVPTNQFTVDTNNGVDVNWIVYVTDANGCPTTNTQTISLDANPSGIAVAPYSHCPSITGTYTFTVSATTVVGAVEYSIGSGFQTSPTFVVNAPGSYNVTVRDVNGCSTTATALVTILQPLTLAATVSVEPTCNNANAEVTLTATGGSIPSVYEYSRDGITYVTNNVFTGLAPSITPYKFYVRDTGTTCVEEIDFTIEPATIITGFALSTTEVTCNGGNDGTITAIMDTPSVGVNDNPVYEYVLSGTTLGGTIVNAGPQNSPLFSGLEAGNYTVDVTSGRGCPATATIPVTEPGIITIPTPTVDEFGCITGNTRNSATITVAGVTGGSGTYLNYEFIKVGTPTNTVVQLSSSTSYTEADVLGGNYIINVYDNNSCVGSTTAVINPYIALDEINVAVNNAITCSSLEEITVTASTIGGIPANLQYTVEDIVGSVYGGVYTRTNTTGIFNGVDALPIGDYRITVLNTTTGCNIQKIHYVSNPNTFELTADNIVDVTCFGGNGSVAITLIDRVVTATNPNQAGGFSYTIEDALGNPVISGPGTSLSAGPLALTLAAGVYTITATLTNVPTCPVSTTFTIAGPTAELIGMEIHTEITCALNDGTITASASGGWAGDYEYELVGPVNTVAYSTNPEFAGLAAGNYTLNVRDSKGCIFPIPVALVDPTPIAIGVSPDVLLPCYGDTSGVITAIATFGQGSNYLYTLNVTSATPVISSGPQISNTFTGLGIGTYTVTASDSWGCSITSTPITITQPTVVEASLTAAPVTTCNNTTTLTLTATGGTAPYSYSNSPNFATSTNMVGNSATIAVGIGTYNYYVRDANNCTSVISNDITIDALAPLVINLQLANGVVNCFGDATGVINANATGGLGNYVYTLLDDATNTPIAGVVQTTPGNFTELIAGTYKVRVDSGDCNTISGTVTITQPTAALQANAVPTNVTCNGSNNGKIVITASGGTGIIKYAISPNLNQFFDIGVFENLPVGEYEIIVQDQNGCFIYYSKAANTQLVITEPTPVFAAEVAGSKMPEMCFGDMDGAFSITISGGTAPYRTSLDNRNGNYIVDQVDFTGLVGGKHVVYIRDANSCFSELPVDLPESVKLNPQAIVDYGCLNDSPTLTVTVSIDPSVTNVAAVDYALDGIAPYQSSNVFTNIPPGVHHITARYSDTVNGLTIICEKQTPDFTILQIDPLTLDLKYGTGLNEIVATATGGAGGYQYTLNGEDFGTKNTFIYYRSGEYIVTVTDKNGCTKTEKKYFEFTDIEVPNVFTPNGDGDNDGWRPEKTENYPDLVFYVFDRYGRKVGTYKEGEFWDGRYEGKELPTGDYWYVIKLRNSQDSREFVGHFTLYR